MNGILGLNVFFRYHEITVIKIIYIITNTSTINCGIFLNFCFKRYANIEQHPRSAYIRKTSTLSSKYLCCLTPDT